MRLAAPERSIGRLQQFHGNAGVLIRAYAYLRALGLEGLRAVSGQAVLNANYLRVLLAGYYELPYDRPVLHEVVFSGSRQRREHGVRTYDIAKRLIDHGFHPPTVYFPLIVDEALMIEPTERRGARGHRGLRRCHDRHRRGGRARPRCAARRPLVRADRPPRRSHRGTPPRAPLAASRGRDLT